MYSAVESKEPKLSKAKSYKSCPLILPVEKIISFSQASSLKVVNNEMQ